MQRAQSRYFSNTPRMLLYNASKLLEVFLTKLMFKSSFFRLISVLRLVQCQLLMPTSFSCVIKTINQKKPLSLPIFNKYVLKLGHPSSLENIGDSDWTRDGNRSVDWRRSGQPAGQVAGRVEILRRASQAG